MEMSENIVGGDLEEEQSNAWWPKRIEEWRLQRLRRRAAFKSPSPCAAKVFSARPTSSSPSSEPTSSSSSSPPPAKSSLTPTNDAVLRDLSDHIDRSGGFWWDTVDVAKIEGKEELEECVRALEGSQDCARPRRRDGQRCCHWHVPCLASRYSSQLPELLQYRPVIVAELSRPPCQSPPPEIVCSVPSYATGVVEPSRRSEVGAWRDGDGNGHGHSGGGRRLWTRLREYVDVPGWLRLCRLIYVLGCMQIHATFFFLIFFWFFHHLIINIFWNCKNRDMINSLY